VPGITSTVSHTSCAVTPAAVSTAPRATRSGICDVVLIQVPAVVEQAISSELPGAEMFGGVVTIEDEIALHYHSWFELQYVISGEGIALDSLGRQIPIKPGGFVFSPAGRAGAHGFRRVGPEPLKIMFMYPTAGGHAPDRFEFHAGE
jgi:quercetin dioxygenase-like cupin family protein